MPYGRRITFAASEGDIIGLAGVAGTVVAGTVVAAPGVVTTTRVTPFDVDTVVVERPSVLTSGAGPDGADGAAAAGAAGTPVADPDAAAGRPDVVTPGVARPYSGT